MEELHIIKCLAIFRHGRLKTSPVSPFTLFHGAHVAVIIINMMDADVDESKRSMSASPIS
jgi:hypothetical protein